MRYHIHFDTRTASKHNKLLEVIREFGLQNMVNDPTRIESGNILDLILTSNTSIITNTHTTPGMSDHEAVTFEVNLNPIRNRKPPHKVFKYKSADWYKLKNEISKLTDEYFDSDPNSQDINTNWTFFRDNLTTYDSITTYDSTLIISSSLRVTIILHAILCILSLHHNRRPNPAICLFQSLIILCQIKLSR